MPSNDTQGADLSETATEAMIDTVNMVVDRRPFSTDGSVFQVHADLQTDFAALVRQRLETMQRNIENDLEQMERNIKNDLEQMERNIKTDLEQARHDICQQIDSLFFKFLPMMAGSVVLGLAFALLIERLL